MLSNLYCVGALAFAQAGFSVATQSSDPIIRSTLPFCTVTTTVPVTTTVANITTAVMTTHASTIEVTTTNEATPPGSCSTFGNNLVQPDGSIRMMDASRSEFCVFKKYSSYRVNDEVWFKACDVANSNVNKALQSWQIPVQLRR